MIIPVGLSLLVHVFIIIGFQAAKAILWSKNAIEEQVVVRVRALFV